MVLLEDTSVRVILDLLFLDDADKYEEVELPELHLYRNKFVYSWFLHFNQNNKSNVLYYLSMKFLMLSS